MDFHQLCAFDFFTQVSDHYGYGGDFQEVVEREFKRSKGVTYLDHAATTLYPESAVRNYCQDISTNLYGNPHSHSPSSRLTHDTVERVRYRILQHFNADPEEYSVIFTSGSTAALRLVAESFPWSPGSVFSYLTDNHTSVVGMRGLTSDLGVTTLPVPPEDMESAAKNPAREGDISCRTPHLFCFPAQSNFSGKRYALSYVRGIRARSLYPASIYNGKWFVLLDAASYVSSSPLNLKQHKADLIPVSFYKLFGFPSGLGALLVHRDAAAVLRKRYFGGGTAMAYLSGEDYYVPAKSTSDRFEDGTISFLDIVALNHSFDAFYGLTGGMQSVQQHTFGLARFTYIILSSLRHGNGRPLAQIYAHGQFDSPGTQGPILSFNLLNAQGEIVGYSQVDRMASLYNIHVRTGCFCNTGACQAFLGISDEQMKRNLQAGHVCGDDVDLVLGQPTGSVRVSFGYMSTFPDCQNFLRFVVECFAEGPVTVDRERIGRLTSVTSPRDSSLQPIARRNGEIQEEEETERQEEREFGQTECTNHREEGCTLTNIYVYPVKSCGAFEVQQWPLGDQGLLFDRGWMVVNVNGVCLSQKREPRLCLIKPEIHLSKNQLQLHATGMESISVPLETKAQSEVCQSKVCGDRVETLDCGEAAAQWLSYFLKQKCRLIRLSPDFTRDAKRKKQQEPGQGEASSSRLSLVNEAQYLMINRGSVELIHQRIHNRSEKKIVSFGKIGDAQKPESESGSLPVSTRGSFCVAQITCHFVSPHALSLPLLLPLSPPHAFTLSPPSLTPSLSPTSPPSLSPPHSFTLSPPSLPPLLLTPLLFLSFPPSPCFLPPIFCFFSLPFLLPLSISLFHIVSSPSLPFSLFQPLLLISLFLLLLPSSSGSLTLPFLSPPSLISSRLSLSKLLLTSLFPRSLT